MSWLALPVTVLAILMLRPLAGALGVLDRPGGRKTHHDIVPAVGGIGIYLGILVTLFYSAVLERSGYVILGLAGAMMLLGLLDDRDDLRPRTRLLGQLAAAGLLVALTGFAVGSLGDLLGFGGIGLGPFAALFTVVATVAMINAFNMLDGLDGLAGGCALVAFVVFTHVAVDVGHWSLAAIGTAVVAATTGFLLFNLPLLSTRRIRVFMGDAGSTMLGFLIAAFGLLLVQDPGPAVPAAVVLWFVPIPVFELYWTTARRLRHGVNPALADAGHWHHVLVRAGLSVRTVFLIYVLFSAAAAFTGLALYNAGTSEAVLFLGFVALFLTWLLLMRLLPQLVPHFTSLQRLEALRETANRPDSR